MTKAAPSQPKTNRTKFKEVFGLNYFYSMFPNKYPPKMLGEKKGVTPKKVSISLYGKILKEYFDIYFKEIYFLDGPSYFLYTGSLTKVKYRPRVIMNKGVKKVVNASIGFMWYQRPSELFFLCCKLKKLTGSTNILPKIEKIYKNNFDVNLIVNFEDAIEEQRIHKNNFIP
jgi:hypothetical protein